MGVITAPQMMRLKGLNNLDSFGKARNLSERLILVLTLQTVVLQGQNPSISSYRHGQPNTLAPKKPSRPGHRLCTMLLRV